MPDSARRLQLVRGAEAFPNFGVANLPAQIARPGQQSEAEYGYQ